MRAMAICFMQDGRSFCACRTHFKRRNALSGGIFQPIGRDLVRDCKTLAISGFLRLPRRYRYMYI